MRKLLGLVAILLVGFAIYKIVRPASIPAAPDPLKEFRALILSPNVSAERLSSLAEVLPLRVVREQLRNRLVTLTGTLADFRLNGVGRNVLDLVFATGSTRPIRLRLDLKKFNTLATYANTDARYEIIGHEVLYFPSAGAHGVVIYHRGQEFQQRSRFASASSQEIYFNAE